MTGKGKIAVVSIIVIVLGLYFRRSTPKLGVVVETKLGSVQGIESESRDGREFYEWLGIPYAKPPVGKLRFNSPQPAEKWEGVLDGRQYGSSCVQILPFSPFPGSFIGEEDCLFVNVHVPKKVIESKKPSPVMVYVHGGGFNSGSAKEYRPDYFMDEDVVLVTINYRLNLFGFLTTGDKNIRGNMGLKDQTLALKWVQENIEFFSGDPKRVTIFGESAGGAAIHYLLLSPTTKGLYQRAISQSGVASLPWGSDSARMAKKYTQKMGRDLGCPSEDSAQLVECMRGKSVQELVDALNIETSKEIVLHPTQDGHWPRPCVEAVNDAEAFLAEHPIDVVRKGKANRVPWMTGVNADEGLLSSSHFYKHPENMQVYFDNWTENVLRSFQIPEDVPDKEKIAARLQELYFPRLGSMTKEEKLSQFTKMFSDSFFLIDASNTIEIQRKFSPVYLYYFNRGGGPSLTQLVIDFQERFHPLVELPIFIAKSVVFNLLGVKHTNYGVCHGDELAMLFIALDFFKVPKDPSSDVYKFSKDMVKLWVDFAYAKPALEFRGVTWKPLSDKVELQYLELAEKPRFIPEPFKERTEGLNSLKYWDLKEK